MDADEHRLIVDVYLCESVVVCAGFVLMRERLQLKNGHGLKPRSHGGVLSWAAPLCPLSPDLYAEIAWFFLAVWSQTNWG